MIHLKTHLLRLQIFVSISHIQEITPFYQYGGMIGNLLSKLSNHCYNIRASFRNFVDFIIHSTTHCDAFGEFLRYSQYFRTSLF